MSQGNSVDDRIRIAGGDAASASHASHESDVHVHSMAGGMRDTLRQPSKYDKTAAILLGWKKGFCDTGVEDEVSSATQPLFGFAC